MSTPRIINKNKMDKKTSKKTVMRSAKFGTFRTLGKPMTGVTLPSIRKGPIVPSGYKVFNGLLIKEADLPKPVDASALKKGFDKAKKEIKNMVNEIASIMTTQYSISEIELTVSFSAEGKFMGFGVGGATSIKIKIAPTSTNPV